MNVMYFRRSAVLPSAIQNIEAIHYAVEAINKDQDILPHVKLGFDLYGLDSCAATVSDQFANLVDITRRKTEPIVGVIGPESSGYLEKFFTGPAHSAVGG